MQARFYLPMYGRFASPDPARDQHYEETQSWNIYSYVQNNPVMTTDPTGMYSWREFGSDLVGLAKDTGKAAVDLAVHNPIAQGFLQASDTIDAGINRATGRNAPMLSELGKAAERGAPASEMAGHALKGPTEVMAMAVTGAVAGKVLGVFTKGAAEAEAAGAKTLSKEAQKGIISLEKQIASHEAKLADFKANPTVRPGMENLPKEVIEKQQAARINHLEKEIKTFKVNIEKLRAGN